MRRRYGSPKDDLQEALRDLGYAIVKATGVIWLVKRLGMKLKPWVQEREDRP